MSTAQRWTGAARRASVLFLLLAIAAQAFRVGLPLQRALRTSPSVLRSTINEEVEAAPLTKDISINTPMFAPYSRKNIQVFAKDSLTIFVVDMSLPGANARISAVKGAISSILPKGKAAVIGCLQGGAKMYLEPTHSLLTTQRCLQKMGRSVKGNVAAGIDLSVELVEKALSTDNCYITLAVVADGRGHGLKALTADCEHNELSDICDLEMQGTTDRLSEAQANLRNRGHRIDTVIIDTEMLEENEEWSAEGALLATACQASYYHAPSVKDDAIMRILYDSKFGQ